MEDTNVIKTKESGALLERLFSVGAHFGYSRSRRHPSITKYIFGTKNKVEIFDLEKVSDLLHVTLAFVEELAISQKVILFVGGKNEARSIIKEAAEGLSMPYVAGRWIGGTLTNFSEIKKRISRLEELTEKGEKGDFEGRYTKKERLMFDRERRDLDQHFGGLISLKEMPHALFVIDPSREHIAVAEARMKGIPIIALLNSDCDADKIEYPLVANDAAIKSISFFTNEVVDAYKRGSLKRAEKVSKEEFAKKMEEETGKADKKED